MKHPWTLLEKFRLLKAAFSCDKVPLLRMLSIVKNRSTVSYVKITYIFQLRTGNQVMKYNETFSLQFAMLHEYTSHPNQCELLLLSTLHLHRHKN